VGTFDMLATSDRDLFSACAPSLMDVICKDGDVVARESCLESRSAAYGQLHSQRMRRSWLIANGCPEATIDAPPKSEVVAAAAPPPPAMTDPPAPAPATSEPATPVAKAEPPVAKAEPPVAKAEPPVAPAAPPPAAAAAEPPPPEPAPAKSEPPPPLTLTRADTPPPPASPPVRSFSERERPEMRERRRDIIIAHGREMKGCVDRQLKLMPDLRADGLLVIEVDANGAVPRAELQGADLAGTALESCLRTITSRWRFPSSGRGYRIEAPLKVSGS